MGKNIWVFFGILRGQHEELHLLNTKIEYSQKQNKIKISSPSIGFTENFFLFYLKMMTSNPSAKSTQKYLVKPAKTRKVSKLKTIIDYFDHNLHQKPSSKSI